MMEEKKKKTKFVLILVSFQFLNIMLKREGKHLKLNQPCIWNIIKTAITKVSISLSLFNEQE